MMLPGIKEDPTAEFVQFKPKAQRRILQSSSNIYTDLLKRKLKEIQASVKIKVPEALKRYKLKKKNQNHQKHVNDFPNFEQYFERIKSLSQSPEKRVGSSFVYKYRES